MPSNASGPRDCMQSQATLPNGEPSYRLPSDPSNLCSVVDRRLICLTVYPQYVAHAPNCSHMRSSVSSLKARFRSDIIKNRNTLTHSAADIPARATRVEPHWHIETCLVNGIHTLSQCHHTREVQQRPLSKMTASTSQSGPTLHVRRYPCAYLQSRLRRQLKLVFFFPAEALERRKAVKRIRSSALPLKAVDLNVARFAPVTDCRAPPHKD